MRLHAGRSAIALAGAVATAVLVGSGAGVATAQPNEPAFAPQSIVWPTQNDGYLLGGVQCGTAPCPAAVKATHDGGKTWATAGRTHNGLAMSGEPGLTSLQFADQKFGWAYDPFLEVTRDAGKTWTQVPLPGGDAKVLNLLASSDGTYVVTSGCAIGTGICDDRPLKVWRAPAGKSTGWKQLDLAVGADDHVTWAAAGSTVYALTAGFNGPGRLSTLRNGTVRSTSTVSCADPDDAAITDLATNGPNRLFVLCMANYGRGHSDKTLLVSGDGGKTFRYDAIPGGLGLAGQLAVAPDGAVMLSTLTASLVYNRPSLSKAWRVDQSWLENSEHIHDLVYQSGSTAWLVERDAAYTPDTKLWVTRDAGKSWQQTTVVPA
ncbi:sialidase family protein [Kribbella sp. NBC_00359]|uniref:sialidase family protein n=1 Tax=Kribbella sp. NBC_00359 TaxID=2975966 RepID=UPI002E22CB8B